MDLNEKKRLLEKMHFLYDDIYSYAIIESLASEMESLLKLDSKYRKPIKEWINGKSEISDIFITCLDELTAWSLCDIAKRLNDEHPNIPIAALLLSLYEEFPVTLSEIIPIAEEICWCDDRIINSDDPVCTFANLNEETEQWFFMLGDTKHENIKQYQLWQVLTQVAILAPIISMDHEVGTSVEMWDDGCYHIIPPDRSEC